MTLGFAAFSTTLNIASEASVTPNSDDFKLKIYGFREQSDFSAFRSEYELGILHEDVLSDVESVAFNSSNAIADMAKINNVNLSINNMNITFLYPSDETAYYYFYIKNVGAYTAYLDKDMYYSNNASDYYTCIVGEDIGSVANPCQYLIFGFSGLDVDLSTEKSVIAPGEGLLLKAYWHYNGPYFDIPVTVQWNNLPMPFTSTPQK
jgi:hypothetical protein